MAADTREDSAHSGQSLPLTSSQSVKQREYERFNDPSTHGNANSLPGHATDIAGGKVENGGFLDAVKSVKLNDFTEIHKKPCVRDSLMTGMSAGFVAGGLRAIRGGPIFNACNWAVGTFCFGSWTAYEYCKRKRLLEKQAVKRAVEIIDQKKAERQKLVERAKASNSQPVQQSHGK